MPVLKPSPNEELRLKLQQCIEGGMKRYKLKAKDMASACGVSISYWYKYREKPEEFKVKELRSIFKKLKITFVIPQEDIELF